MDEPKRGGPKGINWLAVRTYFIAGHSVTECAQRFGVTREVVSRRASKEGWEAQRHANHTDARLTLDKLNTADRTDGLHDHQDIVGWLKRIVRDGEQDLAEIKNGRSRIEARKFLVDAVDKVIGMDRLVNGITSGQASVDTDTEGEGTSVRIVREIVPSPASALA